MNYHFLWPPVIKALPHLLEAALVTLQVTILSMVLGMLFGLLLAYGRMADTGLPRTLAGIWIEIARNTPVLFQIFFFYWGLGEFGLFLSSYAAVVTALTFNTAGYMAETFRGGFNAVASTQVRAARSLGMTGFQTQVHIVIPQVLRAIYYPMTNQFIWVLLMSSLGMLAGLRELAGETQFFNSRTFRTFEFFTAAAIIYYLLAKIIMLLARLIGWRLFRGQAQR
ncbi:ABC transporter permease [Rhizobium anhuiense]|uniref:amino acid ABC transporter permease n=1 Tax=Rhizobium anhuiense TaxID=1184720 RepID=UPI000BE7B5EC|nr:amino acid ABC transporter permease [Rhizobium anhuiense]PDS59938.1 ABC transporter permease [Rhizobium anhuiense]